MDREPADSGYSLSPEDQQFVQEQVDLGRYPSPAEAIREGIQSLRDREQFLAEKQAEITRMIDEGAEQAARGELLDGEQCFKDLERRRQERAARTKKSA